MEAIARESVSVRELSVMWLAVYAIVLMATCNRTVFTVSRNSLNVLSTRLSVVIYLHNNSSKLRCSRSTLCRRLI